MRPRRATGSVVANPVLVGAVTTLVVVVAVFLAYNANSGLPFVPTRQLDVQIANGANLVPGNEVRSGGYRVGVVEDMRPVQLPGGRVGARLRLKLDRSIGALPVDTTITVRPRSALGLKYVELEKGRAREVIPDGGLLPARQATIPVELDEFYNTFDAPTREASQRNLEGFGDTFAGRGEDLNRFIRAAPRLTGLLEPVMANLADDDTRLQDFFGELGDTARVIAPVSEINAALFPKMADTFEAFSRDEQALQETIRRGPRTLDAGTRSLAVQEPFLREFAALSTDLDAAAGELRRALPTVNRALETGTPVTRRSVRLYAPLQEAMVALRDLSRAPTTAGALRGLTATVTTLQPQLRYLGPFITVCNSWNLFWTFTAEHFTAPDNTGSSQRALFNSSDGEAPDSVSSIGANEFVHGIKGPGAQGGGIPQHLHANVWGNEALHSSGRANCQAGNAGYMFAGNRFAPPEYGDRYQRAVVDTPTEKEYPDEPPIGPNYRTFNKAGKGSGRTRDRVPEGQTWTQQPGGKGINP